LFAERFKVGADFINWCNIGVETKMSFFLQLRILLWKNLTLKRRTPVGIITVVMREMHCLFKLDKSSAAELFLAAVPSGRPLRTSV